ncbi:META domain-containing protein [Blastococcus sp. TML/M2B]|uniref:META domain-containing protein n=1 Tax=unclassified Blastococcus TaxID=2619396 RepID=UPI00190B9217|nr:MULTISPECIES: META domain-containing protein [unclassified Blastococcus]MBN1093923.1 META domain-containing protein [Blastococcus sp. TML/M2B]MBN1095959.1 META domain-containing protein [Blastococcus sp. TML/C7B]
MRRIVLFLVGVLALTACGSDDGGAGTGADDSDAPEVTGEWQLASGSSIGADLPSPPGVTATLTLSDGRASGTAFCNRYMASYELDGSSFSFGDIGSTLMGCEPDVMAAESAYLEALAGVDTAVRDAGDLLLTGAGIELRFTPVPAVPDSPLEGTRWVLETLVDGETASSVQGEPTLELRADGTAAFTTGCNGTTGSWRRDGDRVTVEPGASTLGQCDPAAQSQDEQVLAVLTGGATVVIEGDRLTLTAPEGRQLVYRAG